MNMSTHHPTLVLPQHRDLYYGGAWHRPQGGYLDTFNPATGESLGPAAEANSADVDAAVRAAQQGFAVWRGIKPLERAGLLKKVAQVCATTRLNWPCLTLPTAATRFAKCSATP